MYADGVDGLWGVLGVDHGIPLWMLWKVLPVMFSCMRVTQMDVSIELCGICGGSTLGGILGGLADLIGVGG